MSSHCARLLAVVMVLALHCSGTQIDVENLREEEYSGWSRRSSSHQASVTSRRFLSEITIPADSLADEGSSGPDLALKSRSGENLGYSVSSKGRALQLSFVGNSIMSANANRGGFFYEQDYGLLDHIVPSSSMMKGAVSESMACFVQEMQNDVACYVLQHDVLEEIERSLDLSVGSVWVPAMPTINDPSCIPAEGEEAVECLFGHGIAAWSNAVAISGGNPSLRFVQTYFMATDGNVFVPTCTACDTSTTSNLTSTVPTFGDALALNGGILAVGAPSVIATADGMQAAEGSVFVYAAVGADDQSGYGQHRNWALAHTLVGSGNFGKTVSLGPEFLAVGAPGNASFPAQIHIYRITGAGAGLELSEFCSVTHPEPWTYRSMMGMALDQASDGVYTWVVAGARGGNVAYTILLRGPIDGQSVCQFGDTLAPPLLDFTRSDQFGFSVAVTSRQFVFVGAPYYSRWYRQEMSGLVYALAYCFPGSRIRTEGGLRSCVPCELGLNSNGGVEEACFPCAEPIPGNSTFVFGCRYECNTGYVFPDCVICSEARANDPTAVLPPNAHWKDYAPQCEIECDGGYYLNLTTMQDCISCPEWSRAVLEAEPTREWILGEQCTTRCKRGYFEDDNDLCVLCSQRNTGATLPPNAEWVDGLAVCDWVPMLGFRADRAAQNVTACPPKPANSRWQAAPPAVVDARCDFECDDGFHGPALGFPSVCEPCDVLLVVYDGFVLPRNGTFISRNDSCSRDSYVCDDGFYKSNFTHYCCPNEVNNSRPDPSYSPCGRVCVEGFFWDHDTASCQRCTAELVNAEWRADCDFECLPEFFGREDLGQCVLCNQYAQYRNWTPPYQAFYPQQVLSCTVDDWICLQGEANHLAEPPGCCPLSSSIPPTDVSFDLSSPGTAATCGYRCAVNYLWNPIIKNCSLCTEVATQERPDNSEWNYEGQCYFKCMPGFVSVPSNATVPTACLECAEFAASQGWLLPGNATWQASADLASAEECTPEAWECPPGLAKNPDGGLCCLESALPDTSSDRGAWVDDTCSWQCDSGYFPRLPSPEDSPPCVTCREYMERYCAGNSECQLNDCANEISNHCFDNLAPAECLFAVFFTVLVEGVSEANFTSQPATRTIRRELAQLVPGATESQVSIVLFDAAVDSGALRGGQVAAHRKTAAGRELAQLQPVFNGAEGISHRVQFLLAGLDPPRLGTISSDLRGKAANAVASALNAVGMPSRVSLLGGLEVKPSHETLRCDTGYQMNPETRTCCLQEFFNDPLNIDPAVYTWQDNGCKFDCLPTLIGAQCLTCTQHKQNTFKPENAIWDDSSPNCTWKCRTGYVKSALGYECRSIKDLARVCSQKTRCATCVSPENAGLCVWCGNECVPGQHQDGSLGCPFLEGGGVAACTCDSQVCSDECAYESCSDCVQDAFCGWCGSTGTCMLGSYFQPATGSCPIGEWSTGINTRCTQQTGIWLVGLVCASVSTLLVGLMCCYFVLRVRAAQRSQQAGLERFGAQPPGVAPSRAQELTERFLATFPTFKYSVAKMPPNERQQRTEEEEEEEEEENFDEPCCSICLGNFADGEECRMLPCLHVFHRSCIDQWLTVSVECPLCKRSVLGHGGDQPSAAFVEAQRRYNQEEGTGTVTGDVSFQMAVLNRGEPDGPGAAGQGRSGEIAV